MYEHYRSAVNFYNLIHVNKWAILKIRLKTGRIFTCRQIPVDDKEEKWHSPDEVTITTARRLRAFRDGGVTSINSLVMFHFINVYANISQNFIVLLKCFVDKQATFV